MLELADDLYDNVSYWNPDFNTKERIATVLPDLLRDFALKIGHNAETQMHRNVWFTCIKIGSQFPTSFLSKAKTQ